MLSEDGAGFSVLVWFQAVVQCQMNWYLGIEYSW